MNIETWIEGCRVTARDTPEGKIFLLMEYFKPGSNINRGADREKFMLIPKEEEWIVRNYLHSIVHHFMWAKA